MMNVFLFCYWFNFILSFFSPDLEERIFKWVTSCFFLDCFFVYIKEEKIIQQEKSHVKYVEKMHTFSLCTTMRKNILKKGNIIKKIKKIMTLFNVIWSLMFTFTILFNVVFFSLLHPQLHHKFSRQICKLSFTWFSLT